MYRHILRTASMSLLAVAMWGASFDEEYAAKLATTDLTSADAVFELGNFCKSANRMISARKHWQDAIKIDTDHEGARTALGFARNADGKWAYSSGTGTQTKPVTPASGDSSVPTPKAAGPGPAASAIQWDLKLPTLTQNGDGEWLDTNFISKASSAKNDSDLMMRADATIRKPEYLSIGITRLCVALTREDFNDLYLPCMVIAGSSPVATRRMLPFLMKKSEKITDPGDLEAFASAVAVFRDKRSVPRMIELLGHAAKDVQNAARDALQEITLIPKRDVTAEKAKAWWDTYHATPDRDIWLIQLRDADVQIQMKAAESLYSIRDAAVVPAIVKVLRTSEDRVGVTKALALLEKIVGKPWGISSSSKIAERKKAVDAIDKWWQEEGVGYIWAEDRESASTTTASKPAAEANPSADDVAKFASMNGTDAADAERNIRSRAESKQADVVAKAYQALIAGLEHNQALVRLRSYDLLKSLSKQNIAFDANAADRAPAVAAWKAWATKAGYLADPAGEAVEEEPAPKQEPKTEPKTEPQAEPKTEPKQTPKK